jgi:hypothetical protein
MSLHKDLVAAFGKAEPSTMKNIRKKTTEREGYFWKKIDFSIVINASGELIDIDGPPWRLGGKRRRNTLLIPNKQLMGDGASSGFLWGQSLHALGLGKGGRAGGLKTNVDAFNRFKTFHRAALSGVKSPSLLAFVQFLEHWDPKGAAGWDRASDVAGAALVFRFRYDDSFLHESHEARLIWSRLLNPPGIGGPA